MSQPEFVDLGTAVRYVAHEDVGDIGFTFENFRENGQGIKVDLDVALLSENGHGHIHGADLFLRSTSGKKALEKSLQEQTNLLEPERWRTLVEQVTQMAYIHYRQGQPVIDLRDVVRTEKKRWLYEPWVEREHISTIFGDGSDGKSTFVTGLALSVASGVPVFGGEVTQPGTVMYIDWETDAETRSAYMEALCRGLDIDQDKMHPFIYQSAAAPLERITGQLRRVVAENDVVLAIVDSRGFATSGNLELSEGTLGLYRAARQLRCAVMVVDHVSKEGRGGDRAYGNAYAHNSVRIAWSIKKVQQEDELCMVSILRNHKANNGVLMRPRAFEVSFVNDDEGLPIMIHYDQTEMRNASEREEMPQKDQIAMVLRESHRPLSVAQIAALLIEQGTPMKGDIIRSVLHRHRNRLFVEAGGTWGLMIGA